MGIDPFREEIDRRIAERRERSRARSARYLSTPAFEVLPGAPPLKEKVERRIAHRDEARKLRHAQAPTEEA